MKEVSLKILFSVSSHSRFALSTPHRLTSLRVACSLMRTDSILAATLRVSDSSIQSLCLSPLFTDDFCFLFPSPLGSPNRLSLIAFPLLSLYRFHLVYLLHRLLYAPFAFRIHFDLVYPKHEQLGSSLVSTASFCQNRTSSSEQFYFFRFHVEPSKARVLYWKLFCWFLFHTVFHV